MDDNRWCGIYNTETGLFSEVYDELFKIEVDIGNYVKKAEIVIGVVNHFRGPLLFVNDRKYFLKEMNYEFIYTHLPDAKGKFQLVINGEEKENLIYNKPDFVPSPSWGDLEEDVDFFQWLWRREESPEAKAKFHEFYTHNPV